MSNTRAAALRTEINHLALELEGCTSAAQRRAVKLAIRAREFELTAG